MDWVVDNTAKLEVLIEIEISCVIVVAQEMQTSIEV